jgi:hypothetical protein
MKLLLLNTSTGLKPLYDSDFEEKKKLKLNKEYWVEIRLARNPKFHKKFFALLNIGWQNSDLDMPFESYRNWITMKAGYFNAYSMPNGIYYEAKSIAWSKMDEDEFQELYSRVLDKILEYGNFTKEDIERELGGFL